MTKGNLRLMLVQLLVFAGVICQPAEGTAQRLKSPLPAQADEKSLLWRIEGKGLTEPSYLYGTMHVKQKPVFEFSKNTVLAINSCKRFCAELAMDSVMMQSMSLIKYLMMPGDTTLSKLLSPAQMAKLDSIIKVEMEGTVMAIAGLKAMDKFQPIYIMTIVQENEMLKGEMPAALDEYLYNYAKASGLKAQGLETIKEQMAALLSLTLEKQTEMLKEYIDDYAVKKAEHDSTVAELYASYVAQDIAKMDLMANKSSDTPEEMMTELLEKRNITMVKRIMAMSAQMSGFYAVGAAHLAGPKGVVQMLRDRGYTVTAIQNPMDGSGYPLMKKKMDKVKE